jgi:hypothetical protein
LVKGLPPTSASARALDEGLRVGWGFTEELLATAIEVIDLGNRNFLQANGVKRHSLPKPIFIDRPLRPRKRRKATSDDLKRVFGGAVRSVPKEND